MVIVVDQGDALAETVAFLRYFKDFADPRQSGKVIYPLAEGLLSWLLTVLAGPRRSPISPASARRSWICCAGFFPFSAGTPAHDHLGDILSTLDAEAFQRCFEAWVAALIGVPEVVVAIEL